MGSSLSDDSRPNTKLKPLKSSISQYNFTYNIKARSRRLEGWRKAFIEFISSEKQQESKYWATILSELIHYANDAKSGKDRRWMRDPQLKTLNSFSQCSQVSVAGEMRLTLLQRQQSIVDSRHNSLVENPTIFERHNSAMSIQLTQASNVFSSFREGSNLAQELRKVLLGQIEDPSHVVYGIIERFKMTCYHLFWGWEGRIGNEKLTEEHEKMLRSVSDCVRKFVGIMVKLTSWIYKEPLEMFEYSMDQESLTARRIIEDIIYQVMFQDKELKLYKIVFGLLKLKYREEVRKFKEILDQKKEDPLSSYDEDLQGSQDFLLESSQAPYNEAVNKIKKIQDVANPYTKFEVIMSIEDEMWNCVCQYYRNDARMLNKLRASFGMDFRLPIFTYCIVKTQCEDLVIHKRFVEEFLGTQILDFSLGFTMFKCSIDFQLKSPKGKKDVADKQVLSLAFDRTEIAKSPLNRDKRLLE